MNKVIENMVTRRSVKKFDGKMVPEELVAEICKAGTYAPTGMGMQSPIIIAVTNKALRDKLSKMNADVMSADIDPFYNAPVVLVVLARKDVSTHVYDGTLVMENLMLAAHSLGLGSCWIHRAKEEFESEEGKKILRDLGIDGDYEGIGHCVIGYAAAGSERPEKPRKSDYVIWAK
ncbi:MAG: nitroreductase [Bacteroidales bacterium]|nr:nitroreductase [Bacteroidales bacterium]